MKIFLVEDDDAIGTGLKYSLEKEGYEVLLCASKEQAIASWEKSQYALCILDINLPDGNGYDICKYIKSKEDVPIIFLTASDAEVNVVMGLEMGADDYICKPFRINELMARIRTVLRRAGKGSSKEEADQALTIQHIIIYPNEAKVCKLNSQTNEEEQIELTALEYRLLLTFCNNRGVVLSRTQLLEDMWDISGDFVNDNTLTVYIKRLRDKIEKNPANPTIIKTVRGMGYIIEK
ncbi:MAG: response regulator transcription factor [Pseudobutyrivibrio sp.]|uniref:response regulator transcription factor n=1 Tax=Pseudobutyrivibrio sp. TaxID=2014367 RepID=UPI0025DF202E|nr:response regulator transcription factor [Pseudobutyrivibrio sp.]MBQ8490391.1 response regulator transcription factor [Pseudobutyrivibrio sp.]